MRSEGEGLAGLSPYFSCAEALGVSRASHAGPLFVHPFCALLRIDSPKLRVPHVGSSVLRVWRPLDAYFGRTIEGGTSNGRMDGAGCRCRRHRAPAITCGPAASTHLYVPQTACTRFYARIPLNTRLYVLGGHLARKSGCSMFGRVETGAEWESVLMVTRNTGREAHNLLAWKPRK